MSSYGKQRKDRKVGRLKGLGDSPKSEEHSRAEERRGFGIDAAARSQKEVGPLVLIEWVDSYGCSSNWQPLAGASSVPMVCQSVGWLLRDTSDCKVIVPHISDPHHSTIGAQGCGDMTIPTKAVIRVRRLR